LWMILLNKDLNDQDSMVDHFHEKRSQRGIASEEQTKDLSNVNKK